jgi:hypothetical protein
MQDRGSCLETERKNTVGPIEQKLSSNSFASSTPRDRWGTASSVFPRSHHMFAAASLISGKGTWNIGPVRFQHARFLRSTSAIPDMVI